MICKPVNYSNARCIAFAAVAAMHFAGRAAAVEGALDIRPSGMVSYGILQLVHAGGRYVENRYFTTPQNAFDRSWVHAVEGEMGVSARFAHLTLDIGYLAHFSSLPFEGGNEANQRKFIKSGLTQAKAAVALGPASPPAFELTAGLFPYKYNRDAKDLGEYLLTSGVYPGYVFSGFESYKFAGLMLRHRPAGIYTHDLLVTSEVVQVPLWDFSLSYLGELAAIPSLTVAAGVMFYRLFPVLPENTTPVNAAVTPSGESVQLTLRGVKCMLRAAFDVKKLAAMPLLGPEDLRLYAEAAILGVKSYEYFYDDITERIPVMAGFNIPAFKLLDYLSVEGEWYGSPHDNNPIHEVVGYMIGHAERGHEDDFKWALSLQRSLGDNVKIRGRVASDHLRFDDGTGTAEIYEWIVKPDQWYWSIKGIFRF